MKMPSNRWYPGACTLPDGDVFVVGGVKASGARRQAEEGCWLLHGRTSAGTQLQPRPPANLSPRFSRHPPTHAPGYAGWFAKDKSKNNPTYVIYNPVARWERSGGGGPCRGLCGAALGASSCRRWPSQLRGWAGAPARLATLPADPRRPTLAHPPQEVWQGRVRHAGAAGPRLPHRHLPRLHDHPRRRHRAGRRQDPGARRCCRCCCCSSGCCCWYRPQAADAACLATPPGLQFRYKRTGEYTVAKAYPYKDRPGTTWGCECGSAPCSLLSPSTPAPPCMRCPACTSVPHNALRRTPQSIDSPSTLTRPPPRPQTPRPATACCCPWRRPTSRPPSWWWAAAPRTRPTAAPPPPTPPWSSTSWTARARPGETWAPCPTRAS